MTNTLVKSETEDNIYTAAVGGGKYITVVANEKIAEAMEQGAIQQSAEACRCHGVEDVLLTPDAHQGFGVAVGSVIKTNGSIYPSYVGVDIACGMRTILTPLDESDIKDKRFRQQLIDEISSHIPVGPDSHPSARMKEDEIIQVLQGKQRFGEDKYVERSDLYTDMKPECGMITKAQYQLGSLGGGNHYAELQVVEETDEKYSKLWGIHKGQVVITIHSGSRRLGLDVANRYKGELLRWYRENHIPVSPEGVWCLTKNFPRTDFLDDAQEAFLRKYGDQYIQEMYMASNFAVANRHMMQHEIQRSFKKLGIKPKDFKLLYDISHNIAALEDDKIIIRKGATRAFPKGHHLLKGTQWYETGHPIILPGSMDTASYIMVGTQKAVRTHYSINHGAGRTMSREKAKTSIDRRIAKKRMENVIHNHGSVTDIIDETGDAYKNIEEVTDSIVGAGIALVVAKVTPRAVLKG